MLVEETTQADSEPLGGDPGEHNAESSVPHVRIESGVLLKLPRFSELWVFKDLLLLLIWRDISARYRQSIFGLGWVVIRPIITVVIFTIIFGRVAKISPGADVPYALFCFSAILPWGYFSSSLGGGGRALTSNQNLVTKVYFPRILLPSIALVTSLVDFLVQFILLAILFAVFRVPLGPQALLCPAFLLLAMLFAFGGSLFLSALNVKFRDVGHSMPFLIQSLMWLSPVVYPSTNVPSEYRFFYGLNPMATVIDGFRWSLLGMDTMHWPSAVVCSVLVVFGCVLGMIYFQRVQHQFADVI